MPNELGKRAQIFGYPISLEVVLKDEIAEIDQRKRQENISVEEMERKRADEKERGRREIITKRPNIGTILESETLPVCTRTPRMLITGKIVA